MGLLKIYFWFLCHFYLTKSYAKPDLGLFIYTLTILKFSERPEETLEAEWFVLQLGLGEDLRHNWPDNSLPHCRSQGLIGSFIGHALPDHVITDLYIHVGVEEK